MRITRFFSAMLVVLAVICTFVLYASAAEKQSLPGARAVSIYKKSPVERQIFTKISSATSVPSSGDGSSKPAPPDDRKAVMTSIFDSNVSKKYSVVYNLRQYERFHSRKLLIKSRDIPVDFVPLSRSNDNTGGNPRFLTLNFGTG